MFKAIRDVGIGLTRNSDGSFSSTKFWQTVVYTVSTWIMIRITLDEKMTLDFFLVYLAIATGARSFQTFLTNKSSNAKVDAVASGGASATEIQTASKPVT